MSSYLSSEYKIQQPQESVNVALVDNVLTTLNSTYNYNKAQIEQTLAKYQNLKGLREEDNQYIAAKVKEAESAMDAYGQNNGNLAFSNVKDTMLSSLKNVYDDPFIKNAVTQKAKVDQYNNMVDEIRKTGGKSKEPHYKGTYNPVNYQYGLYKAGVDDYMSGKTDTIGSLDYTDYTDAKGKIDDDISKWAKEAGLHKVVSATGGEYFITKTKSEVVSREDILKRISSTLDPVTKQQLTIDAWGENRGLSDEQVNEKFKTVYGDKIKEVEAENIKLAVDKLKQPKSKQTHYDERINANSIGISDYKKAIDSGEISRSSKEYDLYSKKLFGDIADTYQKNDVVDIDWNNAPLEIKKFELDAKYKEADYLIKLEDLKLKKYALDKKDSNGNSTADGTKLTAPPDPNAEVKPADEEARANLANSYSVLTNQLVSDNPQIDDTRKYNDLSKTEQNEYINNVSKGQLPTNLSNKLTPATRNAIAEHASNTKTWNDYRVPTIQKIDKAISTSYTDMLEGLKDQNFRGLNVDNFASSQPRTAAALKAKIPFNKLSASEQNAIRAEYSSNMLSLGEYENDIEERNLKMYKSNLSLRKGNDQATNKYINDLQDEKTSWTGSVLRKLGNNNFTSSVHKLGSALYDIGNLAINGEAQRTDAQLNQEFLDRANSRDRQRANRDYRMQQDDANTMLSDTNLTEIQGYDTKSGNNLRVGLKNAIASDTKTLERALPKVDDRFGYSYSTKTDSEKYTSGILEKIVLNTKTGADAPPINDNIYNIKQVGNTYAITYKTKGNKLTGEHNEVAIVEAKDIPQEILSKYRTNKQVWSHDASNPNATPPKFLFESPETHEDFLNMRTNINENYPTMFGAQIDSASPFFVDKQTERDQIISSIGKTKYNAHKDDIEGVLNSEFEFTPIVRKGVGFDVVIKVDGQSVNVEGNNTILGNYNEDLFQKTCLMLASAVKQKRFNQILE